ncbi:unnamed protein product [Rotaria sp. Silwood1]|nr:unnamed protein product [Rotaria sp. Silwood1]
MTTHLPDQLLQFFYDIALEMTKTDGSSNSDNQLNQQRSSTTLSYVSTQYLFGSSLTEELDFFYFTSVAASQQKKNHFTKNQLNSLRKFF